MKTKYELIVSALLISLAACLLIIAMIYSSSASYEYRNTVINSGKTIMSASYDGNTFLIFQLPKINELIQKATANNINVIYDSGKDFFIAENGSQNIWAFNYTYESKATVLAYMLISFSLIALGFFVGIYSMFNGD